MATKYFKFIFVLRLPIVAIPKEYENKYSVSIKPNWCGYRLNYFFSWTFEYDHPYLIACKPAYAKNVNRNTITFGTFDILTERLYK